MQILLLDGSKENDGILRCARDAIEQLFKSKNCQITSFTLRDLDVKPCLCCFNCWLKTPGVCVINDFGSEIVRIAMQSDLWIFLTPVTYGGYSSQLKKAIDRMPPLVLPFFIMAPGETYHNARYNNSRLIVFGSLVQEDKTAESIFMDLVHRNSVNFDNKYGIGKILLGNYGESTIRKIVNDTLNEPGILNEHKKESPSFSR